MLTILAYIRYVSARTWRNYLLVFIGMLGALAGKPMAVSLPFSLLLLDFWPLRRWRGRSAVHNAEFEPIKTWGSLVIEKIPLFGLSIIGSVLAFIAQKQVGTVRENIDILFRFQNTLAAYWLYVRKTFWPVDLIPIYERHAWPADVVVWGGAFIVLTSVLSFRLRHKYPYILTGWLWYLINLLPSVGLIQIGSHAMADRYMYIPILGVFILVVWGVSDLLTAQSFPRHWKAAAIPATVVLMLCAFWSSRQIHFWRDGITLFEHTVTIAPQGSKAQYLLGVSYLRADRWNDALHRCTESLRLEPTRVEAAVAIATVLRRTGKLIEAKTFYEKVLKSKPDDKDALAGLASLLSTSDAADVLDGEAAVQYAQHLCTLPGTGYPSYSSVLACAYAQAGQFENAIRAAEEGINVARNLGDSRWTEVLEKQKEVFKGQKAWRARF
jgi:cytochrome c-type biogenesis protein CcmH/NrfG